MSEVDYLGDIDGGIENGQSSVKDRLKARYLVHTDETDLWAFSSLA